MFDRVKEARQAVDFADEMYRLAAAEGLEDGAMLAEVQRVRRENRLAAAPTAALECRGLYADLLAEHMVRRYYEGEFPVPGEGELEALDDAAKEKFDELFKGEYGKYGRAVFDTHMEMRRFYAAAAAYARLRPGKKGAADAVPDDGALKKAWNDEFANPIRLSLDVHSNMISSIDRYARALSRLAPEGGRLPESEACPLRVPKTLFGGAKTDEAEIALATLLYYRYEPKSVSGGWSDFYPVAQNEAGVYISDRDQTKAVGKLAKKKNRWLRFREVYFSDGRDKRIMVALSQECVEAFAGCWDAAAGPENYYEITEETPRAVLELAQGVLDESFKAYICSEFTDGELRAWLSVNGSAASAILEGMRAHARDAIADKKAGCKNGQSCPMPARVRDYVALKLFIAAEYIRAGRQGKAKDIPLAAALMEGVPAEEVFQCLEAAKRSVFGSGLQRVSASLEEEQLGEAKAVAEGCGLAELAALIGEGRIEEAKAKASAGSGMLMTWRWKTGGDGAVSIGSEIYRVGSKRSSGKKAKDGKKTENGV